MINATQIAKAFNKRFPDFTRLKQTKDFIKVLEKSMNTAVGADVQQRAILVARGGNRLDLQGTWYDQRLALKLAAWLAPKFELWTFERIRELFTTGSTSLSQKKAQTNLIKSLRKLADKIENF